MKKTGVPRFAWLLVGLLAISAGLISLGEQDRDADPQAESYTPSGISAFAEMLRRNNVPVVIDQTSKPFLKQNDVAVAFTIRPEGHNSTSIDGDDDDEKPKESAIDKAISAHLKNGGSALFLPLEKDFLTASRATVKSPFVNVTDSVTGEKFDVTDTTTSDDSDDNLPSDVSNATHVNYWSSQQGVFLSAYQVGKGAALVAQDGIGITNRFIDKNDNAKAFGRMIAILSKPGGRVVFTEAAFGNVHNPGLLQTIGPWANAAWQQLLFFGLVIVFTLGKRFGLPEEQREAQRGSRELLDAVADTFHRANSTQSALATAYAAADTELRLYLKLPADAPRPERDRRLPTPLQNALARLQVASEYPSVTQDHALTLIKDTQKEMEAFLGSSRARLRRLAKLRT